MDFVRAARAATLVAALFGFAYSPAVSAPSRPPVDAFGNLPEISEPALAPDGKHLAMIQSYHGRPAVTIYTVGAPAGTMPAITGSADWIVDAIKWAKNDRLIIVAKQSLRVNGDDRIRTWYRLAAIKPDATDSIMLFKGRLWLNFNTGTTVVDIDLDDPDNVLAPLLEPNVDGDFRSVLFKVNVHNGDTERLLSGNKDTTQWVSDGHGHVVARIDQSENPLTDHLKLLLSGDWKDARSFDATGDHGADVEGLSEDGTALILGRENDKDVRGLAAVETTTGSDGPFVFSNPTYDVMDGITDSWTARVIGAAYVDDRTEYVYFDAKRQALQAGLQKAFPGVSVHAVSWNTADDEAVVAVDGPRTPPAYYLLDRTTHQASLIGKTYPGLSASDLGEMKPYPYTARDGLRIPAYLTLPPGTASAKNLPVVVMPHGGPDSRDWQRFDWWAQFLANRGYAVLQPNYRGSAGYGHKFTEAGLHQWGLKMQDDISDGVRKLIADGIADPKRICIVGASYGGYAALAGAAFTPDLYACAVSFAGVSDLPDMLRTESRDHGQSSDVVSFWHSRIGSPYEDSEQLRATSPARHADQIKCPVLLMHGEGDTTVRIDQSETMYDALRSAGKDVQFIRFPGEDHYLMLADTRVRMLTELEKFLSAHIGTPPPKQVAH